MKVRKKKCHAVANATRRITFDAMRADPTRTTTLRRQFQQEMQRRFARLRFKVYKLIVDDDIFGLKPQSHDPFTANTRWRFHSTPEKINAFTTWLKQNIATEVLGESASDLTAWRRYAEAGFLKGAGRAFDDTKKSERARAAASAAGLDFYNGTRAQFLRSAFGQPEAIEKLQILAGRTFSDLTGVTEQMARAMARALTDGLAQGKGVKALAKDLVDQVDGIGRARATLIARTEIIRAHAEGQLDAMERLGIDKVGVMVEWSTSKLPNVCKLCKSLEGAVFTLQEARGLIPRHPRCACSWIPAHVGESTKGQKRTPRAIEKAVQKSSEMGGYVQDEPDTSRWPGDELVIERPRPEALITPTEILPEAIEIVGEEPLPTPDFIRELTQITPADDLLEIPQSIDGPVETHPYMDKDNQQVIDELAKLLLQGPDMEQNPLGLNPDVVTDDAIEAVFHAIVDAKRQIGPFLRPTIKDVYVQFAMRMDLLTFESALLKLERDGRIIMAPYTQAIAMHESPQYLLPYNREFKYYLEPAVSVVNEAPLPTVVTQRGRDIWREEGDSFDGTFDLAPNSQSRRVLEAYLEEKKKSATTNAWYVITNKDASQQGETPPELTEEDEKILDRIWDSIDTLTDNDTSKGTGANCGIGKGGFQPGNTCAAGSKGPSSKGVATRGAMAPARREGKGKDAKIVMVDGSKPPSHVKAAHIPPQWKDVQVSVDSQYDVIATGRDAAGRVKTVYRDEFHMRNAAMKFARTREGLERFEEMAKQNQANLQSDNRETREAAACTWLMQEQATRPGSDSDTKARVKAYGATTLLGKHVVEKNGKVHIKFVGKEGVKHDHVIRNQKLAEELLWRKSTADKRDGKLFDVDYKQVVDYARTLDGGKFTPKDWRTIKANQLAIAEIAKVPKPPKTEKAYKDHVKKVAERVSRVLGNRPQQALASYIDPTLFSGWRKHLDKTPTENQLTIHGGPGSGNFGHAGRPGQVGGSAASGTAGALPPSGAAVSGMPSDAEFAKARNDPSVQRKGPKNFPIVKIGDKEYLMKKYGSSGGGGGKSEVMAYEQSREAGIAMAPVRIVRISNDVEQENRYKERLLASELAQGSSQEDAMAYAQKQSASVFSTTYHAVEFFSDARSMADASIEDTMDLEMKGITKNDMARHALFDYVIGYADPHMGNYLIRDKRIVAIDKELAFGEGVGENTHFFRPQFFNHGEFRLPASEITHMADAADRIANNLTAAGREADAKGVAARGRVLRGLTKLYGDNPTISNLETLGTHSAGILATKMAQVETTG